MNLYKHTTQTGSFLTLKKAVKNTYNSKRQSCHCQRGVLFYNLFLKHLRLFYCKAIYDCFTVKESSFFELYIFSTVKDLLTVTASTNTISLGVLESSNGRPPIPQAIQQSQTGTCTNIQLKNVNFFRVTESIKKSYNSNRSMRLVSKRYISNFRF